jgi:hypothetical protein
VNLLLIVQLRIVDCAQKRARLDSQSTIKNQQSKIFVDHQSPSESRLGWSEPGAPQHNPTNCYPQPATIRFQ